VAVLIGRKTVWTVMQAALLMVALLFLYACHESRER
jgi:hypothetical protein